MVKFYKVTNKEEIHYGFKYHNGLNVLTEPFNDDPNISCSSGGLYFTSAENIRKFFSFGTNIREVFLPDPNEHPDFKMVKDKNEDKWRANKIILGKKYSLFDPSTYGKFGIKIFDNPYIIGFACAENNVEFLESSKSLLYEFRTSIYMANCHVTKLIVKNNSFDVLDWLKKNEGHLPETYALNYKTLLKIAMQHKNLDVLDWLHRDFNEDNFLNRCEIYLDNEMSKNNMVILNWFASHKKISFRCRSIAVTNASTNRHITALNWWKTNCEKKKYNCNAMNHACWAEDDEIVEWWNTSGLELKYTNFFNLLIANTESQYFTLSDNNTTFDVNFDAKFISLFNFYLRHSLKADASELFDHELSQSVIIHFFELIEKNHPDYIFSCEVVEKATYFGYSEILNWLINRKDRIKYDPENIFDWACTSEKISVVNWWLNSGLKISIRPKFIRWLIQNCTDEIIDKVLSNHIIDNKIDAQYLL